MIEAKDLQERLLFRAQELQKPVLIFTWNCSRKEFQLDICEDTPMLAVARLFQKIGDDARQWRFEPRQLPRTVNVR